MNEITNRDRMISSENIIKEIDYLEDLGEYKKEDEIYYLERLHSLLWQCRKLESYNFDLIHKDYFTQHCKDIGLTCGYIHKDMPDFISNNINWIGVANDMGNDYDKVDFNDTAYYLKHV